MTGQPLSGIKVLDFTTLLPGPLAALMLAEAGAEVVKIERAEGEDMRAYPPRWGAESAFFALLNRGKKSLALNLKDAKAKAALQPLIREADVIVEQFRPGVMDRLGLGYEDCKKLNPKIVYCSISGFGADGPKAQIAAHDLNYIGDTGLLSLSMGSADVPSLPPALIADIGGGSMPAVINILLALMQRDRTGEGSHIDIAMCDAMFMFSYWGQAQGRVAGQWPRNAQERLTGGSPRYQLYPTADGRFVAAAPLEQRFWVNFVALIGLDERWHKDHKDEAGTIAAIREIIAAKPADHWRRVFEGQDCCCTIVATLEEAVKDEHFVHRGLFDHAIENDKGEALPAVTVPIAPQFRADPKEVKRSPALGADNDDLIGETAGS